MNDKKLIKFIKYLPEEIVDYPDIEKDYLIRFVLIILTIINLYLASEFSKQFCWITILLSITSFIHFNNKIKRKINYYKKLFKDESE